MIQVSHLSKNYGSFKAVKDVSFTVERDKIIGLLGPNGAGKTTVMKILTGYHFPSDGTAEIAGINVARDPVACKKQIGYLPESVPLYGDLTVNEYLSFIAEARLIPKPEQGAKIASAIELCGLGSKQGARIETLSKGYKQRTGLAQAIIHDPPILILDEPTTGLDPNQIIEIRSLIKNLGKRKTVILSTHILQEVEAVCDQVLILNDGRIAAQGTPDSIARTMRGGETWSLILKGSTAAAVKEQLERFARDKSLVLGDSTVEDAEEGRILANFFIESDGGQTDSAESIFDWAVANGFKILAMQQKKLSLEDIFVRLTNESAAKETL
ncbi:MAG: ATP-binding cassette domain-containing protein [Spirochaetaceae bacterium]|jgi:ABC-2 type transport system ATP-binding protein|nr:ATP-binding cassette domain-containing protein [Spirochaetaceae bacterium]